MSSAGCQLENVDVQGAIQIVKDTLDKMTEDGELS